MKDASAAEQALQQLADQYINFEVAGKRVKIPYILGFGRWQFWNTSGKGSPEMIRKALIAEARFHDLDLEKADIFAIYDFMRLHRIGIDCSGLVYHVLDAFIQAKLSLPLSKILVRYPGLLGKLERTILAYKRFRRISAKTLTSPLNTTEVYAVKDIQIGDLIRISRERDHVLIVTRITHDENDTITQVEYAHSSSVNTQMRGPHYGYITIKDAQKGLDAQEWLENTKRNENYGKEFYRPDLGDSVRRLKVLVN